jgi:hypothetical protein
VRLKLDENLPHELAAALRGEGHDVHTVVDEQLAGESDPVIVAAATDEGRLLLTLDRGIGVTCGATRRVAMPASSSFGPSHKTRTASWPSSNDS